MKDNRIISVSGHTVTVRGDNIDTDRIIPARYLMCVSFKSLGEHAFEDDRAQQAKTGSRHSFDQSAFAQAEILFVNKNFGCGSSREHAPQALARWNRGIKAIVGESFAEIFFGNCLTMGIPCVIANSEAMEKLMARCEANPTVVANLDLQKAELTFGKETFAVTMPPGARARLVEGRWDPTAELLKAAPQIAQTAAKLPYFNGWM
jgi:3-isopropylmalate/(R)-2-methylmalate dehydratase small subunit